MGSSGNFWGPTLGLFAVGSVLVGCIVAGYFVGALLDKELDSAPWLMVVFVCLGSVAGFIEMFRIIKRYTK